MKRSLRRCLFAGWLWIAAAPAAWADQIILQAVADNSIYSESNNSNGVGQSFFAGNTSGGNSRRALLRFDLTALPGGAVIQSATLRLYMDQTQSGPVNVSLHRLNASWGEGASDGLGQGGPPAVDDATWSFRFFNTHSWVEPGGDFTLLPAAVISVGGSGSYDWTGSGIVADLNFWRQQPAQNFGWILVGDESANRTAKRFLSREYNLAPQLRPQLIVDYLAPARVPLMPFPGLLALVVGFVVAGVTAARRRGSRGLG